MARVERILHVVTPYDDRSGETWRAYAVLDDGIVPAGRGGSTTVEIGFGRPPAAAEDRAEREHLQRELHRS